MTIVLTDDLIVAAAGGDRPSMESLVAAMTDQTRAMVAARLSPAPGNYDAVDDLAQQAMMGLYEGLPRLQTTTVEGMKAFLSGVVTRKVADYLRAAARSRVRRGGAPAARCGWASTDAFTSAMVASGVTPSSLAGRAEQADRMLTALGQLKPEHRAAVTLAFFDQLPTGQIADLMGISRPAASMLVLRAVRALGRTLLERQPSSVDNAPQPYVQPG